MSDGKVSSDNRASFVDRGSEREIRFGFSLFTVNDLMRDFGSCKESDRLLGGTTGGNCVTSGGNGFARDCSKVGESPGSSQTKLDAKTGEVTGLLFINFGAESDCRRGGSALALITTTSVSLVAKLPPKSIGEALASGLRGEFDSQPKDDHAVCGRRIVLEFGGNDGRGSAEWDINSPRCDGGGSLGIPISRWIFSRSSSARMRTRGCVGILSVADSAQNLAARFF
jgi:hypothetical protein